MAQPSGVAAAFTTIIFSVVLVGCGGDTNPTVITTATAPSSSTSDAPATTTTSLAEGPQPLLSGSLHEPGEYATTLFEPTTVMYRLTQKHLLRAFQIQRVTGFENVFNSQNWDQNNVPYRGVAVHGLWRGLTPEEVFEQLEKVEQIELGEETATAVGGFPGRRIKAGSTLHASLWQTVQGSGGDIYRQWLIQQGSVVDFIILETPAGTLLITIQATTEEWEEFLPIAEEIISGISFPDL